MTDAVIGYGAEFHMEDGAATPVMTKIAEVIEISLPNPQTDDVEATHFESPNRSREYIAGLIDNGEISIGINWVAGSASDTLISQAQTAGESRGMKIVIPTSTTDRQFTFEGIVKGFEKNVPMDDRLTATVTIRVSGAVTQAAVI